MKNDEKIVILIILRSTQSKQNFPTDIVNDKKYKVLIADFVINSVKNSQF